MTTDPKITAVSVAAKSYIYLSQRTAFIYGRNTPYNDWSMLICEEGLVDYSVGTHSGRAQAGDIVLCPPGEVLQREALTTISFHFAVFEIEAFCNQDKTPFPYFGKFTLHNEIQFSLLSDSLKKSKEWISLKYTEHLITDILYQIIRERKPNKSNKITDPLIEEAVQYIHTHVFEEVSTQSAADHVGLYQSQFTRRFQKEMGISPSRYIIGLRMKKVLRMLTETKEPLEQIAHQCGYQNEFYLSRVFSKEIGMSPSRYRHMHQV